jgi:cytosine/adenosine deaminase-related metal-dependent hydrolase
VTDLGEVALMPGLVNAHCHLDYTNLAGKIPPPTDFVPWAQAVLAARGNLSEIDFHQSWKQGAEMLLNSGTTTVANIESMPQILADFWNETPLRLISFIELTNVKSQRPAGEILKETSALIDALPRTPQKQIGLSPHALYSTTPDLCRKAAQFAALNNLLLSTHFAESESEYKLFTEASGSMFDWLRDFRSMHDCGRLTPIQLANEYGLLNERMLAIHLNYLNTADIETLTKTHAHAVHCPRSHNYFSHAPFQYSELKNAGVNICLGTDSLASSRPDAQSKLELNLWAEMRAFSKSFPGAAPLEIFRLTTANAARALHKMGEIGVIKPGAYADLIAVGYSGKISEKLIAETLLHESSVREVYISGELARSA